jgi:hypothetical protein
VCVPPGRAFGRGQDTKQQDTKKQDAKKTDAKPVFLAVFDLRSKPSSDLEVATTGSAVAMFPYSRISSGAFDCGNDTTATLEQLAAVVGCAADPGQFVASRSAAAQLLADRLAEFQKHSEPRAISSRGDTILAVVLQTAAIRTAVGQKACEIRLDVVGHAPKLTFSEASRKSQIETDFNTLIGLVTKLGAPGKALTKPAPTSPLPCNGPYELKTRAVTWLTVRPISLTLKRATTQIGASLGPGAPAEIATELGQTAEAVTKTVKDIQRAAADAEDQKVLRLLSQTPCPPAGDQQGDPLADAACLYRRDRAAGIEMMGKLPTPQRAVILRWITQHETDPGLLQKAGVALAAAATPAAPADAARPDSAKADAVTAKFLSGPMEHWSLSADVFVGRAIHYKQTAAGTIDLDANAPSFYVGFNFLIGDLPSASRRFYENVELKFLVKGSDSPTDSLGFGIGLRGSWLKRFGLDFETLSPFFGWVWTKTPTAGESRHVTPRFGLSVNLSRALDWVK